jgi:hypothetical protein
VGSVLRPGLPPWAWVWGPTAPAQVLFSDGVIMSQKTITFRCVPKLADVLPKPVLASSALPAWLKEMPSKTFSPMLQESIQTAKQCLPFVDAMACGFLMPLAIDVTVEEGKLTWARGALGDKSPIGFHENVQALGTPFFDRDRSVVKFMNYWTIETPPGYMILVTHPINRYDLPFVTVTGLVDSDSYNENFVNFPARWHDLSFSGVLPKGTPVAQCIPVKRDKWTPYFETMDDAAGHQLVKLSHAIENEPGVYRRQYRKR